MGISFNGNDGEDGAGEKKTFDPIPANTIAEVEVVDVTYKPLNEEFRKKFAVKDTHEVSFHFKVIEGPYKNRHIWGTAKPYLNSSDKCRLRIWLQELLGVDKLPAEFTLNENPDTGVYDEFTGMRCRVFTELKTSGSGKVTDRVRDVLRSVTQVEAEEDF